MSRERYNLRVVDAWDYLNEVAFDGEMIRPKISVCKKFHYQSRYKRYPLLGSFDDKKNQIWISQHLHDEKTTHLDVLFHEMVHQYMLEVLAEPKLFCSHGKLFKQTEQRALEKLVCRLRK